MKEYRFSLTMGVNKIAFISELGGSCGPLFLPVVV